MQACHGKCTGSDDNLQALAVSFHPEACWYQIQVLRFGSKHFHPLDHFISSHSLFIPTEVPSASSAAVWILSQYPLASCQRWVKSFNQQRRAGISETSQPLKQTKELREELRHPCPPHRAHPTTHLQFLKSSSLSLSPSPSVRR